MLTPALGCVHRQGAVGLRGNAQGDRPAVAACGYRLRGLRLPSSRFQFGRRGDTSSRIPIRALFRRTVQVAQQAETRRTGRRTPRPRRTRRLGRCSGQSIQPCISSNLSDCPERLTDLVSLGHAPDRPGCSPGACPARASCRRDGCPLCLGFSEVVVADLSEVVEPDVSGGFRRMSSQCPVHDIHMMATNATPCQGRRSFSSGTPQSTPSGSVLRRWVPQGKPLRPRVNLAQYGEEPAQAVPGRRERGLQLIATTRSSAEASLRVFCSVPAGGFFQCFCSCRFCLRSDRCSGLTYRTTGPVVTSVWGDRNAERYPSEGGIHPCKPVFIHPRSDGETQWGQTPAYRDEAVETTGVTGVVWSALSNSAPPRSPRRGLLRRT